MSMNLTLTPDDLKDPAAMGAKIGEWTKKVQAKPLYMPTDAELATHSIYFKFESASKCAAAYLRFGEWVWETMTGYEKFISETGLSRKDAISRAWNFVHGKS